MNQCKPLGGGSTAEGDKKRVGAAETLEAGDSQSKTSDEALMKAEKGKRRAGLGPGALYPTGEAFVTLVREVLALDMRTVR